MIRMSCQGVLHAAVTFVERDHAVVRHRVEERRQTAPPPRPSNRPGSTTAPRTPDLTRVAARRAPTKAALMSRAPSGTSASQTASVRSASRFGPAASAHRVRLRGHRRGSRRGRRARLGERGRRRCRGSGRHGRHVRNRCQPPRRRVADCSARLFSCLGRGRREPRTSIRRPPPHVASARLRGLSHLGGVSAGVRHSPSRPSSRTGAVVVVGDEMDAPAASLCAAATTSASPVPLSRDVV